MQNIGANNADDAFYRYKMPKLVAKVEGRGNGIKTNIVNNVDIARALDRPPTYTLKHFGCELGAQTNFNKETGISIVNGKHDEKKLSEVLEIFIKKYVQCHSCGNPETVVKIRRECIFLKCKACGHTSEVDMRDKLTTFILKNPPENKLSKQEAKVKKAQREREKAAKEEARKALKEKKKKKDRKDSSKRSTKSEDSPDDDADNDDEENVDDDDEDDETEWKTDLSADAVAQRQREQLTKAAAMLVQGADDKAAKEEASGKSNNGAAASEPEDNVENDGDDESGSGDAEEDQEAEEETLEGVDLVRKCLSEKAPLAFAAEMETVEASIVPRMKLFYEAILTGCQGPATEAMQAKDKYIHAMGRDSTMQASQLIALEHYVTQVEPERMKEMPFILKWLYEEDLIDDAIIIAWGDKPNVAKKHGVDKESARSVREVSKAVLDWLEEDSDEDDE